MQLIGTPEHHEYRGEYADDSAENDGENGDDKRAAQHSENAVCVVDVIPPCAEQKLEETHLAERGDGCGENIANDAEYGKYGQTCTDDK